MWFFRRRRAKPGPDKYDVMADDVRPKGITRPLPRMPSEAVHGQLTLHRARINRAVQMLLSAENWSASHEILVTEQTNLLNEEAISILNGFITQAEQSGLPGSNNVASYLRAHRLLLERAIVIGADEAWDEFQARLNTPEGTSDDQRETQHTVDTLRRFLSTDSWSETYTILLQEQNHLLTDTADQFLSSLIEVAESSKDPYARDGLRYLNLHRTLLRESRTIGIEQAWLNFEAARQQSTPTEPLQPTDQVTVRGEENTQDIANAIRSLLTTSTWDETRQILERERNLLLSETCARLFTDLIRTTEREHGEHAGRNLVYLKMHQRLLQLARTDGISRAWASFAEAMGIPYSPESNTIESVPEELSQVDLRLQKIREAVQQFLSASSWTAARDVLYHRRGELLTDMAVALVTAQADQLQARGTERDLYAMRLLYLQAQLLHRAREIGIDRAWDEFEQER
jgi:hypothetical protein